MRYTIFAMAIGLGLVLCPVAEARRHHRPVVVVTTPFVTLDPLWPVDYNVV